ncbi:MAG: hypothetical protein IIA59_00305 [Candidatus Marinimicrobia bacterium]|nr:hypothetical protein [Candidatus Neomarinimicrobiota bacterium]
MIIFKIGVNGLASHKRILGFMLMALLTPIYGQHRIVLSLEKEQYLVDEDIWFEAIEENLTDELVISSVLHPGAPTYCEVILVDSKSDTLPYRGMIFTMRYRPDRWNGHELHPGDQRNLVKELHGIFGERDESHRFSFYLPPGSYTLQVLLHSRYGWHVEYGELARQMGPEAARQQVDRKTIRSNMVEFELIEPQGVEREVHEKLLQAGRLDYQITQGSTVHHQIYGIYKEMAAQYPTSAYLINVYDALRGYTASRAGHKVDLEKQLALFHDRTYIHSLLQGSNVDRLQSILSTVETKYPGSKAHRYIEKEIVRKRGRVKQ